MYCLGSRRFVPSVLVKYKKFCRLTIYRCVLYLNFEIARKPGTVSSPGSKTILTFSGKTW